MYAPVSGDLKSGMPAEVLIPAKLSTMRSTFATMQKLTSAKLSVVWYSSAICENQEYTTHTMSTTSLQVFDLEEG